MKWSGSQKNCCVTNKEGTKRRTRLGHSGNLNPVRSKNHDRRAPHHPVHVASAPPLCQHSGQGRRIYTDRIYCYCVIYHPGPFSQPTSAPTKGTFRGISPAHERPRDLKTMVDRAGLSGDAYTRRNHLRTPIVVALSQYFSHGLTLPNLSTWRGGKTPTSRAT